MLYIWKHFNGTIAQLVEQRTENPCVPGSIPGGTTSNIFNKKPFKSRKAFLIKKNFFNNIVFFF